MHKLEMDKNKKTKHRWQNCKLSYWQKGRAIHRECKEKRQTQSRYWEQRKANLKITLSPRQRTQGIDTKIYSSIEIRRVTSFLMFCFWQLSSPYHSLSSSAPNLGKLIRKPRCTLRWHWQEIKPLTPRTAWENPHPGPTQYLPQSLSLPSLLSQAVFEPTQEPPLLVP